MQPELHHLSFKLVKSLLIGKHANHHFELFSLYRWHQEITCNKTVLYCEFSSKEFRIINYNKTYLIAKLQKEPELPTWTILEAPYNDEPCSHSKVSCQKNHHKIIAGIIWLIQELYKVPFLLRLMKLHLKNHNCVGLQGRIHSTFIITGILIW